MPMVRSFGGSLKSCTLKGTYIIPRGATITSQNIPAPENGLFSLSNYGYNYGCVVLDNNVVYSLPGVPMDVNNGYFIGTSITSSYDTTAYVYEFT